jgi:hypothetical protein
VGNSAGYDGHRSEIGANLQTERSYMSAMATNNCVPQIHATQFELEGFYCIRYFHPATGALCVDGPEGSRPARRRYIRKYEGLWRDQSVRDFLAPIRPETDMMVKLHAYLHLMEEHEDEVAEGMVVSSELFLKVLDTWELVAAIEPVTGT